MGTSSPVDGGAIGTRATTEEALLTGHSRSYRGEPISSEFGLDEPECTLIGTEDLPLIGAAGVLVLPKRLGRNSSKSNLEDDPFQLGREELTGWGWECQREDQSSDKLLDAAHREKRFKEYVERADPKSTDDAMEQPPMEELKALAAESPAPNPLQGPGILQLAMDPKRREECPVCNAEWKSALRQLGAAAGTSISKRDGEGASTRRRNITGRGKMHSIRCTWTWFQQNLTDALCALRFDSQGNPRQFAPSPNRILPLPMMDVWNHWKQRGTRTDRAVTDRLCKGEPSKGDTV
jgi:hypothetical protein